VAVYICGFFVLSRLRLIVVNAWSLMGVKRSIQVKIFNAAQGIPFFTYFTRKSFNL